MKRMEVHKFGGTSMADSGRIHTAATIIAERSKIARQVVVSSATSGTTDLLINLGTHAAKGQMEEVRSLARQMLDRHLDIFKELSKDGFEEIEQEMRDIVDVTRRLSEAVGIHGELTPRVYDRIVVAGEKIAVRLLALTLRSIGIPSQACDADQFLLTDSIFGEANALPGITGKSIAQALNPILDRGIVPVVTGFCGKAPDGATTTLGRGGSDLSATLIGAALDADEVTIWTDVDGVMTANPKVVPGARVIRYLNYREAAEMSFYGAKVLHQRTMIPVSTKGIPVRTLNTNNPKGQGTIVDDRVTPGSLPVKAISAVRDHSLLSIEGKGMAGVPGISARLFSVIAGSRISVTMYSQSSSEASICLALPKSDADEAKKAIEEEFQLDIARGHIEEITIERDAGLVAIVGLGMAQTPGVAGRATMELGEAGVNILAIAQGSSELNLTLAVDEDDVERAVRILHNAFGLHRMDTGALAPDGLNLILLGTGKIGRALAQLVVERHAHIRQRFGLDAKVVALADSSGYILEPKGFDSDRLFEIMEKKAGGIAIANQAGGVAGMGEEVVRAALAYRLTRPILVDTSDADDAHDVFFEALQRGCDVVTANKKPLAGDIDVFSRLLNEATKQGRVLKAEATVGAGLPVIDTLEVLLGTGDHLHSAEGSLSGTLGYIMHRLEKGAAFSNAVVEAHQKGFTEPDPAVDLTGADVARKAIILGRLSKLIDADIEVELEGFVEESWSGLPFSDLKKKLVGLDDAIKTRVDNARKKGHVLRYLAKVERGRVKVGPVSVSADSPAGRLSSTENLIMFYSDRYDTIPLVITGPGAGIDVTAMGVLGDVLRIAAERGRSSSKDS